jgi:hypothetical protein
MIGGPKVTAEAFFLVTRDVPKFQVFDNSQTDQKVTVYGTSFEHVAAPAKPLVGTVRDKDTGRPLAGVKIDVMGPMLNAVTDRQGKYRLESMPWEFAGHGFGLPVLAIPSEDQPYLVGFSEVKRGPGLEAATVDFALKRGVWVEGKVTNQATGKPVRAYLRYHPADNNPQRQEVADFTRFPSYPNEIYRTRPDGTFRIAALPGPGIISADGPYGEFVRGSSAHINPDRDGRSAPCVIYLDPGRTLRGTILDPDGKPLSGVRLFNVKPRHFWASQPLAGASFTLTALDSQGGRSLIFLHPEKHLVKALEVRGDTPGPLTIRLEPAGTLTGRLVETGGQPRPHVPLAVYFARKDDGSVALHLPERVTTDQDGRFRIEGVAPGLVYQILEAGKQPNDTIAVVATRLSVKAGETKDLGDVKAKPFRE